MTSSRWLRADKLNFITILRLRWFWWIAQQESGQTFQTFCVCVRASFGCRKCGISWEKMRQEWNKKNYTSMKSLSTSADVVRSSVSTFFVVAISCTNVEQSCDLVVVQFLFQVKWSDMRFLADALTCILNTRWAECWMLNALSLSLSISRCARCLFRKSRKIVLMASMRLNQLANIIQWEHMKFSGCMT